MEEASPESHEMVPQREVGELVNLRDWAPRGWDTLSYASSHHLCSGCPIVTSLYLSGFDLNLT